MKEQRVVRTLKDAWIKQLKTSYKIVVLEQLVSKESLAEREKFWIEKYACSGSLTNMRSVDKNVSGVRQKEIDQLYLKNFGKVVRY